MRIEGLHFNTIFCECPPSVEQFFSGRISKILGYIPIVGTVIGVSRLAFSAYQYVINSPGWTKDRLIREIARGLTEAFSLGPLLLIYDLFFAVLGAETAGNPGYAFIPLQSRFFSAHAEQLVPFYTAKPLSAEQLSRFQTYRASGAHPWQGQTLFSGADFFTRHGAMHASFVAMFVPVFISLYRYAGHPEAARLCCEDVLGLQAAAFLHDYGRIVKGKDLTGDNEHMERIGEEAAYRYMNDAMGYSDERSRRLSHYIMTKDAPLEGKPLLQQVLQNCDSLAVLRADDWYFDRNYLDLVKWINATIPTGPARDTAMEELNTVIDSAKRLLVEMGDSPYSMPCHSRGQQGQAIQGHFSLETKRNYEKSPHCYSMILQQMQRQPALWRHFQCNV